MLCSFASARPHIASKLVCIYVWGFPKFLSVLPRGINVKGNFHRWKSHSAQRPCHLPGVVCWSLRQFVFSFALFQVYLCVFGNKQVFFMTMPFTSHSLAPLSLPTDFFSEFQFGYPFSADILNSLFSLSACLNLINSQICHNDLRFVLAKTDIQLIRKALLAKTPTSHLLPTQIKQLPPL